MPDYPYKTVNLCEYIPDVGMVSSIPSELIQYTVTMEQDGLAITLEGTKQKIYAAIQRMLDTGLIVEWPKPEKPSTAEDFITSQFGKF
jgi:hypothetical protein